MPFGPVGIALLTSAINGLFSIGSTVAQNRYNSPLAQRRRLRKAGLPLSYMYRGNVATQSETPTLSIDPQIGFRKKELQNQTKIADATVPKLTEETEKLDLANDIQAAINDWMLNQGKQRPSALGPSGSNLEINLQNEQDAKNAASFIKQNQQRLTEIQRIVENTLLSEGVQPEERRQALIKIKAQITNMAKQAGLMDQLKNVRSFEEFLNSTVTENITSLPQWAQALTATILKLSTFRR